MLEQIWVVHRCYFVQDNFLLGGLYEVMKIFIESMTVNHSLYWWVCEEKNL